MKLAKNNPATAQCRWLLLIYQLPSQPAYLRTKIWRRLQTMGALAVRSSAYVLPLGEEAREDFHWLIGEIVNGGGEAALCEANLIDGLTNEDVEAQFNIARDQAYAELIEEARLLLDTRPTSGALAKLRRHFEGQKRLDFFGAEKRGQVERLLTRLEDRAGGKITASSESAGDSLIGRVWVTRARVFIDRIACAWVVKRFIDPDARFKFVSDNSYRALPGELRFDMFEGEIGHEGDRCSMEVLIERAGLGGDAALCAIAEIVHDIDLKDEKYGRLEAPGVFLLLNGVCAPDRPDEQRIARASTIFNDLYDAFAGRGR